MDSKMEQREMISALADGQLRGEAFAKAVDAASSDAEGRQAWQIYHLIGDVLRTGQAGAADAAGAPDAFLEKLSRQLALEEPLRPVQRAPAASDIAPARPAAANDFRWKLVAGVASVAAVSAVAWTLVSGTGSGPQQPQLANATVQPGPVPGGAITASAGERGVMIRDPRLDEILEAHRQFGGASALQMPAGFLRNATFEGSSR